VSLAALGEVCGLLHGCVLLVMLVPTGCCSSGRGRKRHWQWDGYELLVRGGLLLVVVR
jgi:hypothetical protein